MGVKIDALFSELIALVSRAQFAPRPKRPEIISQAIEVNDVLKFMLYALFELAGLEEQYFLELADKIEEAGRLLYGWKNNSL